METITFTATATYPTDKISAFAVFNGYKLDSEQTAEDFISDFIKKQLVEILLEQSNHLINAGLAETRLAQLAQASTVVEGLVSVTNG
jgi:hypothetical protein